MEEQLVETWQIHNRIHLYILDAVPGEALAAVSPMKGRNAGEQFAHIHNVRLMWLTASAPELMRGLSKLEKGPDLTPEALKSALSDSGLAIEKLLQKGLEAGGKIKGFKPHVAAFLGYLISHESYHRGEIGLVLASAGHPLDKKTSYGMWEWGVR